MKKTSLRLLALLAVVFCCLPMLFTSLADDTAKEAGEIDLEKAYEELYVRDVDGDGKSDVVFLYDAFGKTASDKVSTTITDRLGNQLQISSGTAYGEDCHDFKGKKLDLTPLYNKSEDIYMDLLLKQNGDRSVVSGSMVIGPSGKIQIQMRDEIDETTGERKKNNSPINESYGVISGTYWNNGDKWGTDVDWKPNRFLGAYIGEIYSIGVAIDKTIAESASAYTMTYYRDGETVHGASKSYGYQESADTELYFGSKFHVSYYAIRLYTKVLTESDIANNRFADLMNYYRPDNFDAYVQLSDAGKERVKEACASLKIGAEGVEDAIKAAITKAYEDEMGGSFMTFDGYSMRMIGAHEMRISYTIDVDALAALPSDTKVLEMGVLHTPVGAEYDNDRMKKQELTLDYADEKAFADKTVFYAEGATPSATYTKIFDCGNDAKGYGTEHMVRGYVIFNKNGETVIYYENAESERFGASVSLARLSAALYADNKYEIPDLHPEAVLESIVERADEVFDAYEQAIKDAAQARLAAESKVASAKDRANALKDALKEISLAGVGANEAEQATLKAQAAALLAEAGSITADANTAPSKLSASIGAIADEAGVLDRLLPLAAEAFGFSDERSLRMNKLFEDAVAEEALQNAGFFTTTKRQQTDVTNALNLAKKIGARVAKGEFGEVKTFKVLAIGNSFSQNAMSQLYQIAEDLGYEDIILGNLYIGGCSIETHAANARDNIGAYSYQKNSTGTRKSYSSSTILDGLQDEEWQVITVQQVSHQAPVAASLTDGNLDYLLEYVLANKNADAKIYYHATWAYSESYNFAGSYKDRFTSQADMDEKIQSAVETAILPNKNISGVIYSGVSVKAAREALGADHALYSDNSHLGERGCYVIGLTWFGTLTGEDISACADVLSSFTATEHASAIAAAKVGIAAAK